MFKRNRTSPLLTSLSRITFTLAMVVVVLGAYTRLKDAGLGCPDWPGCYGQLLAPTTAEQINSAQIAYPQSKIESGKAWIEMVHRYVAGSLGLLIVMLGALLYSQRSRHSTAFKINCLLILLVIAQAALGMWTVTLRLYPVVVMAHLLGGFATLSLIWLLHLHLVPPPLRNTNGTFVSPGWLRALGLISLFFLGIQIMLGGWTSANYAALVCADFPTCQGMLWPELDWRGAFNFTAVGIFDSPGEPLQNTARVTIQVAHRLGALIAAVCLFTLALQLISCKRWPSLQRMGYFISSLLVIQILLGISNVLAGLPLFVSLLHNATAAMLLILLITTLYILHDNRLTAF